MPKKEKSPRAMIGGGAGEGGGGGGNRNEHPRRDKTGCRRFAFFSLQTALLLFPPVVSRFFVLRYSLYRLVVDRPSSSSSPPPWRVTDRKDTMKRERGEFSRGSGKRGGPASARAARVHTAAALWYRDIAVCLLHYIYFTSFSAG